ncbi:MAG TPA: hypothetical protein VL793_09945 [Patescibacteria group bacterium]|nr:hypothetical protein [Patescibacteria group bacterium]
MGTISGFWFCNLVFVEERSDSDERETRLTHWPQDLPAFGETFGGFAEGLGVLVTELDESLSVPSAASLLQASLFKL